MDIPALPTDNLYKFAALCGLLLVVVGVGYPSSKVFEIELYQNEVGTEIAIAEEQANAFTRLKDRITKDPQRTQQQIEQFENIRDDRLERTAQIRQKNKRVTILLEQTMFYMCVGVVFFLLGALLSAWGFANWLRLQRATDAIVLNELATASAVSKSHCAIKRQTPTKAT